MAHQAHNIPWTLVSSHLAWRLSTPCGTEGTDLHLRFRPDQGKQLTYFANAFARTIREHSEGERRKFPQDDDAPAPGLEDVVVQDHVAGRIAPTVRRWRDASHCYGCQWQGEDCRCAVPCRARRLKAFHGGYRDHGCYTFWDRYKDVFFNVEVFKTLLLYGEMDTLFKICAHPENNLKDWWQMGECQCLGENFGWGYMSRMALDAYILLNVIHHFPETWEASPPGQEDYRRMRSYQNLVYELTQRSKSELATYPHRQFFGIKDDQFGYSWRRDPKKWSASGNEVPPWGHIPYEHFLRCETVVEREASPEDISHVRWLLCEKGLPTELANLVLGMASYSGQRRLPIAHDPFHAENREELGKYLKYCWQLIVRTEAVGRALGMEMDWETEVSLSVVRLFDCSCYRRGKPRLCERDYEASRWGFVTFV